MKGYKITFSQCFQDVKLRIPYYLILLKQLFFVKQPFRKKNLNDISKNYNVLLHLHPIFSTNNKPFWKLGIKLAIKLIITQIDKMMP